VSLYDIQDSSEGIVLHGDGCVYHKAIFRLIVFKPFIDEIILGKVGSSSKDGVKFSLGFFDDCWIPAYRLMPNCAFDPKRSEFYWVPTADENADGADLEKTPEDERYYILQGETVRVRVISEVFNDVTPKAPPKAPIAAAAAGPGQPAPEPAPIPAGPPPYRLECSMQEDGFGLLDWWKDAAPEEGEEGEGGDQEMEAAE